MSAAEHPLTTWEVSQRVIKILEETYDVPLDWLEVHGWISELHEIQEAAKRIKAELLRYLYEAQPDYEVSSEVGTFRKTTGKRASNWDHPLIASALAARAADDFGGEPPAVFAEDVAKRILSAAGISYWRKGELKRLGLDPARYCEEKEGEETVIFKPAKEGEAAA